MKIRKLGLGIIGASLLVLTGFVSPSAAGVNVNIMVPPPLAIPAPPPVVVIPGTYVYRAPDVEADILFYHGYWWRPYEGRWYRSSRYDGDWRYFPHDRVPHAIRTLPPDYRHYGPSNGRIQHDDMRRNWRQWEREKHWDKHERKAERKERKHEQKEERKERKDHRDHGDHGDRDRSDHGEGHRGR